jgi:hypothetical protein
MKVKGWPVTKTDYEFDLEARQRAVLAELVQSSGQRRQEALELRDYVHAEVIEGGSAPESSSFQSRVASQRGFGGRVPHIDLTFPCPTGPLSCQHRTHVA